MLEEWHTKLITLIPREGTETVTCSIPQKTQVAELITLIPREGTETRAVHVQHLLEHLR